MGIRKHPSVMNYAVWIFSSMLKCQEQEYEDHAVEQGLGIYIVEAKRQ